MTEDRKKYPYLIRTVSRHGKVAWYVWRRPRPRIRIRGEFGSREFNENYWTAISGAKPLNNWKTVRSVRDDAKFYKTNKEQPVPLESKIAIGIERSVKYAKVRSREKGLDCDIDYEWALKRAYDNNLSCELTGIQFFDVRGDGHRVHPYTPTIDRIDPDCGYTKLNCRIICWSMNGGLNEWGVDIYRMTAGAFAKRYAALSS